MNIICHDLISSIISWIPPTDLKTFSDASPIFAREIFAMGIRVVYYRNVPYVLKEETIVYVHGYKLLVLTDSHVMSSLGSSNWFHVGRNKIIRSDSFVPGTGYYIDQNNIVVISENNVSEDCNNVIMEYCIMYPDKVTLRKHDVKFTMPSGEFVVIDRHQEFFDTMERSLRLRDATIDLDSHHIISWDNGDTKYMEFKIVYDGRTRMFCSKYK